MHLLDAKKTGPFSCFSEEKVVTLQKPYIHKGKRQKNDVGFQRALKYFSAGVEILFSGR